MGSPIETDLCRLCWGEGPDEALRIDSVNDLDTKLDALEEKARGRPFIVELVRPEGAVLALGLGRPDTVLSYSTSPDPPYFHSVGDKEDGTDLVFWYYGEWTDFPRAHAVPAEVGREALRHFVQNNSRPPNVAWEET